MARQLLRYIPVGLDRWDPKTDLRDGQVVRITDLAAWPASGSLRYVFVEDETGQWKGLVLRASLQNVEHKSLVDQ